MIIVLALVIAPLATFLLWRNVSGALQENHIVEWSQAILLVIASLIHVHRAINSHDLNRIAGLFHITLALLCLSLFAREVDVDQLSPRNFWPAAEVIFRSIIVILWVLLGLVLTAHQSRIWIHRNALLLNQGSHFVYAGILFYGASWFFDKELFPIAAETSIYFEETLHLVATLCLFFGALFFPLTSRTARNPPSS